MRHASARGHLDPPRRRTLDHIRLVRLLLTTQVFPPEAHPTAVMAAELASGLARRGWEVCIAAGLPHHPTGRVTPGYGRRFWRAEERDGYRVLRFWHPTSERRGFGARVGVMIAQTIATAGAAVLSGRPDVVLSFGGPPLVGPITSGLIAAAWRVPLVTVVHDIYPDVAIENGAIRNRLVVGLAHAAERIQYRLSDRLVVLGDATRNLMVAAKKVDPGRIDVLPVWLDPDEIRPGDRMNAWRAEQGIRAEDFVVLYSGTAGIISGAEILAEVARRLPKDVLVVLVGGGSAWSNLRALGERSALPSNLRLIPYQPRERLAEVQATSDLSLLTLLPGRGKSSVPSKLQGYMAAARPVLAAVDGDGDTAAMIEAHGFGRVVGQEDPQAIASAILELRAHPDLLARWGEAARRVFEREHAREPLIERYTRLLGVAAGAKA